MVAFTVTEPQEANGIWLYDKPLHCNWSLANL
jgi:hypothetical protein